MLEYVIDSGRIECSLKEIETTTDDWGLLCNARSAGGEWGRT